MRSCESSYDIFSTPIDRIEIDAKSSDDILAILLGLQHLYVKDDLREQVID